MAKIPFFHYTHLKTISKLLSDGGLMSRDCIKARGGTFRDIAVEVGESKRAHRNLTRSIPMFPGFYSRDRSLQLNMHMWEHYEEPPFSNSSYFGSLNRTLRERMGKEYQNVVSLLLKPQVVRRWADAGRARFFDQIAIKPESREHPAKTAAELEKRILDHIDGYHTYSEVDVLDDCKGTIAFPGDIEVIVVDNADVKKNVLARLGNDRTTVLVSPLPRVD